MKIYENYFAQLSSTTRFDNGMRLHIRGWYEDRIPIVNTTDYSFVSIKGRSFTPNYPVEQLNAPFPRHQAVLTSLDLQYQPGQRFIEFPDRKISIGSRSPTLEVQYVKDGMGCWAVMSILTSGNSPFGIRST